MNNVIDEESFIINELLLYAREGYWDQVFEILGHHENPKKGYLINVIPEERRWGILHQALYWKSEDVLNRLLLYPSCDPEIKTKVYTTDAGEEAQDDPLEVANKEGFSAAERIIQGKKFISQELDTFLPDNADIDKQGISILSITLAAYKMTFHPTKIDPNLPVFDVLREVFETMNTTNLWEKIRDIIYDSALVVDKVKKIGNSKTRADFYRAFIEVYTDEETHFYDKMNTALRRQKINDYRPSGKDIAIGPFITTFNMILLFWDALPRESRTTYRQVLLNDSDLQKYQTGVQFSWHTFVSSATARKNASNFPTVEGSGNNIVMFIINNRRDSFWRPRNVSDYSSKTETEKLYPVGARFRITQRERKELATEIKLELM